MKNLKIILKVEMLSKFRKYESKLILFFEINNLKNIYLSLVSLKYYIYASSKYNWYDYGKLLEKCAIKLRNAKLVKEIFKKYRLERGISFIPTQKPEEIDFYVSIKDCMGIVVYASPLCIKKYISVIK